MCFCFRDGWHSKMWPLNSLPRSGSAWTLLRGPCTEKWWWRPSETCSLWVRITSLQKLGSAMGSSAFSILCLLGAPAWPDWAQSPVNSDMKSFLMQQDFELVLSSYDLPISWSRVIPELKYASNLITNRKYPVPSFLPLSFWFRNSWKRARCLHIIYYALCIQNQAASGWIFGLWWGEAVLCGVQELSSPTRNRSQAPGIGSLDSTIGPPGRSHVMVF